MSREYFKHVVAVNSETISSFATTAISFFSKRNKTSWHLYGRRGVTRGGTIPRAPNYYGAPNHYGERRITAGAPKSPNNIFFLQYSTFASQRPQIRTWGHQTCFLSRALSNLVTPLHARVSCTCFMVWASSPNWISLLRMWLSKPLQLNPRSATSSLYGRKSCFILPKPFQKLVQIHTNVFIQKHIRQLWWDNAFHNSSFSIEIFTDTFGSWID